MMRDLVHLPRDLFGYGWLLGVWLAVGLGFLAWAAVRGGVRQALGHAPMIVLVAAIIAWGLPAMAGEDGIPIRGYGAMLVLAIVSGCWLAAWRAARMGLGADVIFSLAFWALLFGIGGARLFYIAEYWRDFQGETLLDTLKALVNVTEGGLVVYGAALGGFAAIVGYLWRHRLPILATGDVIAPAIGLGLFFGRLGCFLNGCCYGGATDLPWGVCFPAGSPPYVHQLQAGQIGIHGIHFDGALDEPARVSAVAAGSEAERAGLRTGARIVAINDKPVASIRQADAVLLGLKPGESVALELAGDSADLRWTLPERTERSLPVHPTQIYSALDGLILCLFLLAYYPYRRRDGEVVAWMFTIYPVTRFLIEMIRDDEGAIGGTGLTVSQNVSLLFLVVAAWLWLYLRTQPRGSVLPPAGSVTAAANS